MHRQQTSGRAYPVVSFVYLSAECPFDEFYGINGRPKLDAKLIDRLFHRQRQVCPPVNSLTHRFFDVSHVLSHESQRQFSTDPRLHCMNQPWLTTSDWPVRAFDSNAAKNSAASATSSTPMPLAAPVTTAACGRLVRP